MVLRSSNIHNNQIVLKDTVHVSPEIVNTSNVNVNDIIVVARNGSRKLIGKHARVLKAMPNTVIGAFMTGIRSQNSKFVNALFDGDIFQREIYKNLGATINQITIKSFKEMEFYIPQNHEKQIIGNLISQIDNLLALQQRKLKLLKAIKFYLLNQFLLNNNKWPKKKFGNLVNINRGLTYHPFDVVNSDGIRVLRSSNIKDSRISFNKDDVFVRTSIVKEKYQLKKNDILVTAANGSSNLIGKHALMTKNIPNQVGGFMFSIETNEPYFIFACLESNWFKKLIHKSTTGGNGALGNLKGKDIKNAWIHIPEREIRERIGELEKNIDNFIDYNQKIVNKLIKFKQFLLQNMFI